jgi:peptidoglycan hydrolase-like protein with peptidoglycan-binding domain
MAGLVLAGLAVFTWYWLGRDQSGEASATTEAELGVAEVVQTDLRQTTSYEATLGRVSGDPIVNRLNGTVTWLPDEGSTVEQGGVLFEVDGSPVVLLYGERPAWRALRRNTEGADVAQLETALAAMGFDPDGEVTVDDELTSATVSEIEDWQEALGAEADGVVDLGEVVFLPGPVRVSFVDVSLGSPIHDGEAPLRTSSEDILVRLDLPASDQGQISVGDSVTIELPDGTEVAGTVQEVDDTATVTEGQAVFQVTIGLDDPALASGLDEAPVDVDIVTDEALGVMAVPVTALLALAEGGYAVEVVDSPANTHLVGVEAGLFADGWVEVTGDGLEVGDQVVVP